ncbi:FGGY-family carbohydrate kinase [Mesorhizobium sp. BAC0120]|uniref:FGGY-family carbohydrate kinase n=1 Tax=Mesorhizobium sp. BAC0120 TaxID=3090670 RepID=UPI00298D235B|nr:FGGY-family carbohydrate kinase [Mesorhizobium sp. BAC0120]MDW6026239.1 FGGY-family carbohydrate kinase [Mesorhizobium sp. BAC0120]
MPVRHVAVIDIGKTNAKVVVVDLDRRAETGVRRMPNAVLRDGPYPHFDTERLWAFVLDSLAALNREQRIDAVSITTHGATAALIDAGGRLALPILDYEHDGPDRVAGEYDAERPPFAETGTPRLPVGLNLGAQLFWQARTFPEDFARTASILMYPQYWAFRLTGVRANETTSLGCHTDLWGVREGHFSSLVERMGWRELMAPVRRAADRLSPILPEVAAATGLASGTPVHCGIHDSNASLLPHLIGREQPFSVVSTGTWVISMAIGGERVGLDPTRDTLVNVSAFGEPVPSARFMGGREFAILVGENAPASAGDEVEAVLKSPIMLTPSIQRGSGPFPDRKSEWIGGEPEGGVRTAAASFYLALMTATALELIGAKGPAIIEGPFAANVLFAKMLAAATAQPVISAGTSATGTSIGAALLAADGEMPAESAPDGQAITSPGAEWEAFARRWRQMVG